MFQESERSVVSHNSKREFRSINIIPPNTDSNHDPVGLANILLWRSPLLSALTRRQLLLLMRLSARIEEFHDQMVLRPRRSQHFLEFVDALFRFVCGSEILRRVFELCQSRDR